MNIRMLRLFTALMACIWAVPAGAGLSLPNDALLRGFNDFAQANGRPARMTLKFTNTSSVGLLGITKVEKFAYDLDGCLLVTAVSQGASQTIDTLFASNSACTLPCKLDDLILLARYLASLSTEAQARRAGEEIVLQAFKAAQKARKRQTVSVGSLRFDIDPSSVLGWAMWVH
jgi:hypothetical protein